MQPSPHIHLNEAAELCQLSVDELNELLEYGSIAVIETEGNGACIPSQSLNTLRQAAQIRRDYALDLFTIAILMNYLQKITDLEHANSNLRSEVAKCMR